MAAVLVDVMAESLVQLMVDVMAESLVQLMVDEMVAQKAAQRVQSTRGIEKREITSWFSLVDRYDGGDSIAAIGGEFKITGWLFISYSFFLLNFIILL